MGVTFQWVRVSTFSAKEIGGVYSSCPGVLQYITSVKFGYLVIQAGRITKEPKKILMILKKAVQTFEEDGLHGQASA